MALTPFIDTEDLTDYIGRDVETHPGAIIAVDAACSMCRTVAGQDFNKVTGDEIDLDGTGTDALLLPQRPVTKVSTVTVAGDTVTDWAVAEDGILVRRYSDAAISDALVWPVGRRNVSVKYDHGYTAVPTDVRMVALAIASRLVIQGVAESETVGPDSIRYHTPSTDFTHGERMILAKYSGR